MNFAPEYIVGVIVRSLTFGSREICDPSSLLRRLAEDGVYVASAFESHARLLLRNVVVRCGLYVVLFAIWCGAALSGQELTGIHNHLLSHYSRQLDLPVFIQSPDSTCNILLFSW